jgi:hypothetical protein
MLFTRSSALALMSVVGTLAPAAFAQEGTLNQSQLLTITSPFGTGVVNSVTASAPGVLIDASLGDEAGDFSRVVIGADFYGAPLDFSGYDTIAVKVKVTQLNVPFIGCKAFVQTPDGNGGYGFNEGLDVALTPNQTATVSVPLGSVLNTDQLSRFGIQFFGPGPLFPGEEPIFIQIDPTTPVGCSPADLAAPFGSLNFFDVSAYLGLYNGGCQATGSVGSAPYSLPQEQLSEMNAISGTLNSAVEAGTGVDFNCTLADGGGFTQVSLAYLYPAPVDLSANDTIEFEVNLIAGDGFGCRIIAKDGPSYTYNAGSISELAVGVPTLVSLDLSAVGLPGDIREVNIEFFGAAIGDLNSTEFDVNIRPVDPTCGGADLAAPFGTLNFFDISTFLGLYNAGCP